MSPGPAHSLDPLRLNSALKEAAKDLGREPDLVFLHNPERSLRETVPHHKDLLAAACTALDDAKAKGLCGAWGVASWDPSPVMSLVDLTVPRPSVHWQAGWRSRPSRSTGSCSATAPVISPLEARQ
ncbi:aldo/keto reductase [Streptomyces sp. NPDC095602]|uniref:aldo/keto reductase n=1 Tax=Streptomyces sp. NPDC095602 TaxID=3155819 RepID=UPI003331217D